VQAARDTEHVDITHGRRWVNSADVPALGSMGGHVETRYWSGKNTSKHMRCDMHGNRRQQGCMYFTRFVEWRGVSVVEICACM